MSGKKAKEKRAKEAQQQPLTIPLDQVVQLQFTKIGQLSFQIDIMAQQMRALENECNQLREQLAKKAKL